MYYATKRSNTKTRIAGVVGVVLGLGVSGYALANGLGIIETNERIETEVVMIEELDEVVEDEPPPPPVDVDLPPPPPQVILPDFVFDTPPPQENAVRQVQAVANPAPPPPPAPTSPITPATTMPTTSRAHGFSATRLVAKANSCNSPATRFTPAVASKWPPIPRANIWPTRRPS
jgi:protein TonB